MPAVANMDVTQGSSDSFAHGSNSRWQLYWPYLSALAVLLFASHVFWNYQKLSGFGGSLWAALSSIPHRLAMLNGKTHLFYAQANQKYGKEELGRRCILLHHLIRIRGGC